MTKSKWVWMPHPQHLIVGHDCRYHLATEVGGYIVSTLGEYWPDSRVRETIAKCRNIILEGMGDSRSKDYMEKIGYEDIGFNRQYETMVFKSKQREGKERCCPFVVCDFTNLDFLGYNDPTEAYKGHLKLCEKWSKKGDKK